ncbi:MAG: 50S ribosomal protein L19 [Candidatus Omnitrophota bacterium]|nr:50S ribosomal protein L19 [Candidatus Omnitrophota bacterium]
MNILEIIESGQLKKDIPKFNVGDIVKVTVKFMEADKVRLHPFEGVVISKKGKGVRSSFTVRKVIYGEGVERIFPLHSPSITGIEVLSQGRVKRSKLYYLRQKTGRASRIEQKQISEQK